MLKRLNAETRADFDLDAFRHEARWHEDSVRIEMRLVACGAQRVRLDSDVITFEPAPGAERRGSAVAAGMSTIVAETNRYALRPLAT